MKFSLSSNMHVFMALLFAVIIQVVYGQLHIFDEDRPLPECPKEALVYYKDCYGPIGRCSMCLANAEKECRKSLNDENKYGTCYYCTASAAGNCRTLEYMCYSDQDCNDPEFRCLNGECIFRLLSK